ncbi:copper transporting ATPase [Fragilariopsis cylindrus CCMP1102]|uniref:P-type Cu(+) transporter n=1 Tax=Fragilariopsis cylindrus CCMP1102 TaxID=635003 RepID=A0A1E7ESR3_9STRA|nr:copper transporting ATPase [Fragilariopsis cylindrus CCMP1102]|eukprot:OEU09050.1 copper transporting ATPase [Fragilariopsis cylindrus CCMP1102]
MTCSMCTKSIETALSNMDGVSKVNASLAFNSAHVDYDPSKIRHDDLINTIEDIGYDVVVQPQQQIVEDDDIERGATASSTKGIVEFTVSGMTCSMCSQSVVRALESTPGVKGAIVTLSTNQAKVEFDSSLTSVDALNKMIEDIGYDVVGTYVVHVPVMMDSPNRIDRMLEQQGEEVTNRKRAFIWSLLGTVPILILTMVFPHFPSLKIVQWLQQPIVITMNGVGNHEFVLEALILFALCTPIQFGCGYPFYKSSYYGLRQGLMGMDVLVCVGTTASYGYALWATVMGGIEYHFFETSAVLICFVLLGKWMQTLAVRRTSQALTHLLKLQPKTAIKVYPSTTSSNKNKNKKWNPLNDPYTEESLPITTIQAGDFVKILKGSSIPADGIIRFGEMTVDESMITGESIPVLKTSGAVVLGGTICAEAGQDAGASFVEVTGVGENTALSQILQLVQDAQSRQVPIQELADKISGVFVPTVVILSVVTFMVWYALIQTGAVPISLLPKGESPSTFSLLFGISCLVISCPCALGLATPTAVIGSYFSLVVTDSIFWDDAALNKVDLLPTKNMDVTDSIFWDDAALNKVDLLPTKNMEECILWLLGSLERNSEHLLASAIVRYTEERLLEGIDNVSSEEQDIAEKLDFAQPSNFVAMTGRGASGTILGEIDVSVGNRSFCEVRGFEISKQVEENMQRLERQGKTAIVAAVNGTVVVVMGVADELKADASSSVIYMKEKMGLDVWMVTGDNRRTARAIAKQLQLPENRVIAEALPVAKVEKVQELQAQGCVVAMVGDGVNDSPALVQADVGLSIGKGAEIAAEASDMILVRGNVTDVCTALDVSRVIFRRIQLNFIWSLLYNCLSIPLAAGVFYPVFHTRLPPTVAALAMALSSLSVVASSLALHLYRPPKVMSSQQISQQATSSNGRNKIDDDPELHALLLNPE